jgi:putative endonuclease
MNTTGLGAQAETLVASELERRGYKILAKNWKTQVCEIDIIASKQAVVYFTEVKYRSHDGQGGGLEYMTPKKLRQMKFAAEVWVNENKWQGDYRLIAAAVSSPGGVLTIEEILEIS